MSLLTDKEIYEVHDTYHKMMGPIEFARAVEAAIISKLNSAEPVAWTHSCNVLCLDNVELWIDRCPHCGKPSPLVKHPPAPSAEEATRLLERASISIGEFVSDQGWAQSDMDTMDSIDAYLFRLNAKRGE